MQAAYGGGLYYGTASNCLIVGNAAWGAKERQGGGANGTALTNCIVRNNRVSGMQLTNLSTGVLMKGENGSPAVAMGCLFEANDSDLEKTVARIGFGGDRYAAADHFSQRRGKDRDLLRAFHTDVGFV